jgi:alcohol dehydrogenase class IV
MPQAGKTPSWRDSLRNGTMARPHIHFGAGEFRGLPRILAEHDVHNILLVSGANACKASGVEALLGSHSGGLQIHRFADFSSNPAIDQVEAAVRIVREKRCDAVVAIGGGTAIDIGKAAAALALQERAALDCLREPRPLPSRQCLLVAAPTTAGTGSEVTSFSVIYVEGRKHSLDDQALLPDHAIVDPELSVGLPPRTAASAALDAISQAIESLWSVRSTDASRDHARKAAEIGLQHIKEFCRHPQMENRTAMAQAALLAGQAINVTRTTAPHAVSYALTTLFDIPHGHSCALTLPAFLVYNAQVSDSDVLDSRGVPWVRQRIKEVLELLHADSAEEGRTQLLRVVEETGLESRLSSLGLEVTDIQRILNFGFDWNRAGNNPRRLTEAGLREVLNLAF